MMRPRTTLLSRLLSLTGILILASTGLGLDGVGLAQAAVPNVTGAACGSAAAGAVKQAALLPAAPSGVPTCPTGLISYWKLDEDNGATQFADSANGHKATCSTECPTAITGTVNNGQSFITTTQVSVVPNVAFNWGAGDSFSIELWWRLGTGNNCAGGGTATHTMLGLANPTAADTRVAIGRADPGLSPEQWWLGCDGGNIAFYAGDDVGGHAYLAGDSAGLDSNWHHVVGVRNATDNELLLYIDGNSPITTTAVYTGSFGASTQLDLGWYKSGTTYHWVGGLDEIALYNRALTPSEIERHYTSGLAGHGICDLLAVPQYFVYMPLIMR